MVVVSREGPLFNGANRRCLDLASRAEIERSLLARVAAGDRPFCSVRSRPPPLGVRRVSAIKPTSSPAASAAVSVSNVWDSHRAATARPRTANDRSSLGRRARIDPKLSSPKPWRTSRKLSFAPTGSGWQVSTTADVPPVEYQVTQRSSVEWPGLEGKCPGPQQTTFARGALSPRLRWVT